MMAFVISAANSPAPKVMLHPRGAIDLRQEHESINANVVGLISWARLVDALREVGEIKTDESVEAFVLTDIGIQFYVRS